MANIVKTDIDIGSFELRDGQFQDDVLTLVGADTVPAGTILARDSVSGNLVYFVIGGATNENGIPKAIIAHDLDGAIGDNPVRVLVQGEVIRQRLIVQADGDASNIDAVVKDQLRDYNITAVETTQLAQTDN